MPQGSLALYRRHLSSCKRRQVQSLDPLPVPHLWVQGSIGGETIRRSLNTGNWTAASSIVHQWQSCGRIGVLKPELPPVNEAVAQRGPGNILKRVLVHASGFNLGLAISQQQVPHVLRG